MTSEEDAEYDRFYSITDVEGGEREGLAAF
jgi:hypothetical protein